MFDGTLREIAIYANPGEDPGMWGGVLAIDPLSKFHCGVENSAEEMTTY